MYQVIDPTTPITIRDSRYVETKRILDDLNKACVALGNVVSSPYCPDKDAIMPVYDQLCKMRKNTQMSLAEQALLLDIRDGVLSVTHTEDGRPANIRFH